MLRPNLQLAKFRKMTKMLSNLMKSKVCLVIYAMIAPALFAQATFPTTTLSSALTGWPAAHLPATNIFLGSTAAIVPGQNPISTSGIGEPSGHTNQILMVDTEAMCVAGSLNPNGSVPVRRGCQGTKTEGHNAGAVVWVGFPSYYALTPPSGACDPHVLEVLPTIYLNTGVVYDCVADVWVPIGLASDTKAEPGDAVWHAAVREREPWYKRLLKWFSGR